MLCRHLPPILASRMRLLTYSQARAARERRVISVQAQTGSRLEGDTFDFHFYPFSIQGYFEFRSVAIALALAGQGDTIIEIGANVGTETVSFSDVVGADGIVHAFEPLPNNADWIRHAARVSRHGNIIVHECALGDTNERRSFTVPPAHSSGTGHLLEGNQTDGTVIDVEVVTLDSLSKAIGPATVVFVDIEGYEMAFLRGARDYLAAHRPVMLLEASPKLLRRGGSSLSELHATVVDYGYTPFTVGRFRAALANPTTQRSAENWLCLPAERRYLIAKVNRFLLSCAVLPCIKGVNPLTRA